MIGPTLIPQISRIAAAAMINTNTRMARASQSTISSEKMRSSLCKRTLNGSIARNRPQKMVKATRERIKLPAIWSGVPCSSMICVAKNRPMTMGINRTGGTMVSRI